MDDQTYSYLRGCNGKIRYVSQAEVRQALRSMKHKARMATSTLKPYQCDYCGCWHLGNEWRKLNRKRSA